jgi:hypothetical protein
MIFRIQFTMGDPNTLQLSIGECPSNSPFLKNNGAEAPKRPRPIVFKESENVEMSQVKQGK